ncbi:hypothetical protein ACOKFD_15805 [Flagellimonas sp. S174]|uniref:hypothetical protein n=1 Tax=Flagellimonas sp. S174 TaxID=3410790 RepID=UPI003BF50C0E
MKKPIARLLFVTVLLLSNFVLSQEHSFLIKDGGLTWQKIYKQNLSVQQIEKAIRLSGKFEDLATSENQIICSLKPLNLDFKSLGKSSAFTSIYVQQMFLTALLVVDIKEGRHRVTFKNLEMTPKEDTALWSTSDIEPLSFYALRKQRTEYKKYFLKNDVSIFEYNFTILTNFKPTDSDDDW